MKSSSKFVLIFVMAVRKVSPVAGLPSVPMSIIILAIMCCTYLLNTHMFIETLKTMRLYERQSKLGVYHTFHRKNTIYVFKCDSCGVTFLRPKAQVDPDRASNDYKHVCSYCDTKKYAQKVGVKMRKIYQLDASSTTKTL